MEASSPAKDRESAAPAGASHGLPRGSTGLGIWTGLFCSILVLLVTVRALRRTIGTPGDTLALLRDNSGQQLYRVGDGLLPGFFDRIQFWDWSRDSQWIAAFSLLLLGILSIALLLPRLEGARFDRIVLTLVALSFVPWLREDPSQVADALHGGVLLSIALGAALARSSRPSIASLACVPGGLAAAIGSGILPLGQVLMLAVLGMRTNEEHRSKRSGPHFALPAYLLGYWIVRVLCPDPLVPTPAGGSWWGDLDGPSIVAGLGLVDWLLLFLAMAWLYWTQRRSSTRFHRLGSILGTLTMVLLVLFSAWQWRRVAEHDLVLRRDLPSLRTAVSKTEAQERVWFLGMPLHLRPYIALATPPSFWGRKGFLRTLDSGAQIELPDYWRIPDYETVLRWTPSGIVQTRYGGLLELPAMPRLRIIDRNHWDFAAGPLDVPGMGEVAEPGPAVGIQDFEVVDLREGQLRVRLHGKLQAGQELFFAVATWAPRSLLGIDAASLSSGLRASVYAPPFASYRVTSKIPGQPAPSYRGNSRGYGPVFSVRADGKGEIRADFQLERSTLGT